MPGVIRVLQRHATAKSADVQGGHRQARLHSVIAPEQLDTLDTQQMRQALLTLMAEMTAEIGHAGLHH
jgi:mRNA-degrading endonuclease toxin of MazEF toxin-antitoxin module